jgi:hypothetical protein
LKAVARWLGFKSFGQKLDGQSGDYLVTDGAYVKHIRGMNCDENFDGVNCFQHLRKAVVILLA